MEQGIEIRFGYGLELVKSSWRQMKIRRGWSTIRVTWNTKWLFKSGHPPPGSVYIVSAKNQNTRAKINLASAMFACQLPSWFSFDLLNLVPNLLGFPQIYLNNNTNHLHSLKSLSISQRFIILSSIFSTSFQPPRPSHQKAAGSARAGPRSRRRPARRRSIWTSTWCRWASCRHTWPWRCMGLGEWRGWWSFATDQEIISFYEA